MLLGRKDSKPLLDAKGDEEDRAEDNERYAPTRRPAPCCATKGQCYVEERECRGIEQRSEPVKSFQLLKEGDIRSGFKWLEQEEVDWRTDGENAEVEVKCPPPCRAGIGKGSSNDWTDDAGKAPGHAYVGHVQRAFLESGGDGDDVEDTGSN